MTPRSAPSAKFASMFGPVYGLNSRIVRRAIRSLRFAVAVLAAALHGSAQNTPLISG